MRLILVDLDGTLLDPPSSERRFIRHLAGQRVLGARQWLAAGGFFLRWTPRFGRAVGRKNKAYLSGLAASEVARAAQAFVAAELLPRLRPVMLERLRRHAAAGDALVLLTGAPGFIAAPVARHIGARWCAAEPVLREGRYTARPPRRHPLGAEKLALAGALARAARVDLRQCVAYADSGDDIPLLRAVGRAVAVAPDRRLAREAIRRGWEVLRPEPRAGWGKRILETDV
ncbi:MAG: HAD-IB family phosphatase [Gammaproteobacteria bacterium]|nr:HAD-IB family phosphatase [Gammaproteobacteria bacterium]